MKEKHLGSPGRRGVPAQAACRLALFQTCRPQALVNAGVTTNSNACLTMFVVADKGMMDAEIDRGVQRCRAMMAAGGKRWGRA